MELPLLGREYENENQDKYESGYVGARTPGD